ncbi:MAG: hypothetical protein OYH77_02770 [Pseudomonadota bacterium]|nr:hypothetical protein [Pseudomonadota bacterium]
MSKIKNFEDRQEFERAFLPEWKRVELGETAKAFSDVKRKYDQKIAGWYSIGTGQNIPPPNSHISLKTVCRFG